MERQEFLAKLGIGILATCAGCELVSCGSKTSNPTPGNNGAPGAGNQIAVNLDTDLKSVGDSMVSKGVIIVRLAAGNTADDFTAVQVACTHQGSSINYHPDQGIFICPNHGSEFNTSGAVLQGPATAPLKEYTVVIAGNTLTVTT